MLKRIVIGVFAKFLTTFRKITHLLSLVFRKHVSTSARCVESTGCGQQTFVISFASSLFRKLNIYVDTAC